MGNRVRNKTVFAQKVFGIQEDKPHQMIDGDVFQILIFLKGLNLFIKFFTHTHPGEEYQRYFDTSTASEWSIEAVTSSDFGMSCFLSQKRLFLQSSFSLDCRLLDAVDFIHTIRFNREVRYPCTVFPWLDNYRPTN